MSRHKQRREWTTEEMERMDNEYAYRRGRQDAFDHGKPETVLEYWDKAEPDSAELAVIVKNILHKMQGQKW